ncbi:Nup133 N terminal like-domain-containing protein [Blakeslea trispora]|nr:Nup133 N terminal like-domain-containing protein [Blakeslea trispora]
MNNTVLQLSQHIPSKYADFMKTGREVEQVIVKDSNYTDLAYMLKGATSSTYAPPLISSDREFCEVGKIGIPSHLYDKLASIQCRTFSGIFPQISRAWMTIDNILYLWDYTKPNGYVFEYKDQDQVIISAEIMKPRKGFFDDSVEYVIAVATPLQIIFLAASDQTRSKEYTSHHYFPKPDRFQYFATRTTITTDETRCRKMLSTEDGRLFLISTSGDLHEIILISDHWFSHDYMVRRTSCAALSIFQKLMNTVQHPFINSAVVDNERKTLYLLCENSTIEVVYLGDPKDPYQPVFMYQSIAKDAVQLATQSGKTSAPTDFEIDSIHVISTKESKRYHLVAVTKKGHRLYFSHHRDGIRSDVGIAGPPNALVLGHVRFPHVERIEPGERIPIYSRSFYDRGLCISVRNREDLSDSLKITSVGTGKLITNVPSQANMATQSSSPFGTPALINNTSLSDTGYYETAALLHLPERVNTIVELESDYLTKHAFNEASEQLSDTPRRFAVLTTRHIIFYQKERPVDMLHYLIKKYNERPNDYDQSLETFSKKYAKKEACAMCLSIACHSLDPMVVKTAVTLFERFGGKPSSIVSPETLGNYLARVEGTSSVVFSGKRDGLLLYFARIISPVWKLKFFAPSDTQSLNSQTPAKLVSVRDRLTRLREFLERNSRLHTSSDITDSNFGASDDSAISSEVADRQSMHDIYTTLVRTIEAISFIVFAVEATMYTDVNQFLSGDVDKNKVHNLDLCSIMTTAEGRDIVDEIAIGIIVRFRSGYSHVGYYFVSKELENKCSHFFVPSDIAFFKGLEYLLSIDYEDSETEKERNLKQSLIYFKQAAGSITRLSSIFILYKKYSFYLGVLELALERAYKLDPTDSASVAFEAFGLQDEAHASLLHERLRVYQYFLDALTDVASAKSDPALARQNHIEYPDQYFQTLLNTALTSKDRLFHYRLYQWLIEKDMMDELLSVDAPWLLEYLDKHTRDDKMKYTFQYKYHQNREEFLSASEYKVRLALIDGTPLRERIQCLEDALLLARCVTDQTYNYNQEYLNELNLRLKMARLQERVKGVVHANGGSDEVIKSLDQSLFSLEQLYSNLTQYPEAIKFIREASSTV